MAQYRLESIGELARQMRFTPIPRRLEQLDAAEDLLLKLCPEQTYTLAEILTAITGYEPRQADKSLLTGVALQHDLGMLLEEVSDSLQLHVNSSPEPILTIEEAAQRLSVTTKTIQRWRRRGLPARRFTYCDGKRRIGFRFSSLQRFLGSPAGVEQVTPVPSTGRDLRWLRDQAQRLACRGYWRMLAAQRLGAVSGLAPLTLEGILREHAGDIEFAPAPDAQARAQVIELREEGTPLNKIACRLGIPLFGVYRVILEDRITRAIRRPVRFHDDPLYHQPDAADQIEQIIRQESLEPALEERIPRDLPPYLRDLYRIPLLSAAQERGLFLKYHYLRFLASQLQKELDPQVSRYRELRGYEQMRYRARLVRAKIVEANLRLVVNVARKHVRAGVTLMELVSEGNMTLIRAADAFDVHRGHRFSTYATYALMRAFARYIPTALAQQRGAVDPEMLLDRRDPAAARPAEQAMARDEVRSLLACLDKRERDVVCGRYGLRSRERSCRELARELNLSSQRIVQIEQAAMAKLREQAR